MISTGAPAADGSVRDLLRSRTAASTSVQTTGVGTKVLAFDISDTILFQGMQECYAPYNGDRGDPIIFYHDVRYVTFFYHALPPGNRALTPLDHFISNIMSCLEQLKCIIPDEGFLPFEADQDIVSFECPLCDLQGSPKLTMTSGRNRSKLLAVQAFRAAYAHLSRC